MKYLLTAMNSQGASVSYWGDTKKEVMSKFRSEYYTDRKQGWSITIVKVVAI